MTTDFFKAKRPWSRYKDQLLVDYLPPYLAKIKNLRKPVTIVDAFAGRGQFADGERGSPLIIADAIKASPAVEITQARFIEADRENLVTLKSLIEPRGERFRVIGEDFDKALPEVARIARSGTLFLYLDPYNVRALSFPKLAKVYENLRTSGQSVEVLINFNSPLFVRWCLAALKRFESWPDASEFEAEEQDLTESPERQELVEIAGGSYWEEICLDPSLNFAQKVFQVESQYMKLLATYFRFVCRFHVQERLRHTIPKYTMIFATRSRDGLELMNDAMRKSRKNFVEAEVPKGTLFDVTPQQEIVEPDALDECLKKSVQSLDKSFTREMLRFQAIRRGGLFGRQTCSEINQGIGRLLQSGILRSVAGKKRINDTDLLERSDQSS